MATLVMLIASSAECVAQRAAVSGVVRDTSGVAQLGVLVQLMAADSSVAGRAFTDLRGHYLVNNLAPGRYQVQATVALFAPALKPDLHLRAGARAVVNLTMSTLFETTSWLPAQRRKADEPTDDWMWTLRSAANRPILRMVEDGQLVMVSSSTTESRTPTMRGRATVTSNDGEFGKGGIHNVLTMDTVEGDGARVVLRADTGVGRAQLSVAPSTELTAAVERQVGFASTARAVVSFQSHPELISAGNTAGLQTMELATAQQANIGDLIKLEVGSATYAVHTAGYGFVAQPFIRVMVEPSAGWTFGYRMATSRDLQEFSGLNAVQPDVPIATMSKGRLKTERGRHQEMLLARKLGRGRVQLALYSDTLQRVALAGVGALTSADLNSPGTDAAGLATGGIADSMTDSFRFLTGGYRTQGINLMLTQPIGQTMWAAVEYSTGKALTGNGAATVTLPETLKGLHEAKGQSASIALKGSLPGTGTKVRAVYRWQPRSMITPVDAYREFSDQAFLSFHVRQPVRWEGVLPPGLEASVDVTNLLAQGYQPFLSSDGRTLYLAQAPRALQAGLSINF
ncbi:MAG: carboxypeptidase-like regulatory domain-containing protein [Granulicella sp.]